MKLRIVYNTSTLNVFNVKCFRIKGNMLYVNNRIVDLDNSSLFVMVGNTTIDHYRN